MSIAQMPSWLLVGGGILAVIVLAILSHAMWRGVDAIGTRYATTLFKGWLKGWFDKRS